jgi:hypothetical protein
MQPGEDKLHLDAACLAFDIKGKMLEGKSRDLSCSALEVFASHSWSDPTQR